MEYNDVIWRNRDLLGFTSIIYQYKCKLKAFDGMSYFGYTDNFDRRLEEHTIEAIEPRRTGRAGYVSVTKLHNAIREIFRQDPYYREFLLQGGSFTDIYYELENMKGIGQFKSEMNYIINDIIKKYFELFKVEMTKGSTTTRARENYCTINYQNSDGIVNGTVGTVEFGLNDLVGGAGGGEDIPLPNIDIAAILTLAISYNNIHEIITKEYDIIIGLNTFKDKIKNMWGENHIMESRVGRVGYYSTVFSNSIYGG
ncbi:MAG: hypothetical protein HWN81_22600 [Candidatus Lokiarchaeota archaeon]|nr:hypothetical protein [Candidatus Lokiarchaeota archaeon]